MAFTVIISNGRVETWHIPNEKPKGLLPPVQKPKLGYSIRLFQADGDELEHIRARFDNIHITKGGVCQWTGETAEFIFNNL